jgi:hypothetical protein
MKLGQKVKIKETGQVGWIHKIDGDRVVEVKTSSGKIINVVDKTIMILSLIREILELITQGWKKWLN